MKLYMVQVTKIVYVLAENERQAELDGPGYAADEGSADVEVYETNSIESTDPDWRDAIPYGGAEDKTCRQIFEELVAPEPYDDPAQLKIDFGSVDGAAEQK